MEYLTIMEKSMVFIALRDKINEIDNNIKSCQKYNLDYKCWVDMKDSLTTAISKIEKMETIEISNLLKIS